MRRDMELVREILFDIANNNTKKRYSNENELDVKYVYHFQIMKQEDLIDFNYTTDLLNYTIIDNLVLTWHGNDYLDAISNESIWKKTKTELTNRGLEFSNVPFQVLKDYAVLQMKQLLGMD